jgi:uncharacterized repeat protein (TIGR03803 family)
LYLHESLRLHDGELPMPKLKTLGSLVIAGLVLVLGVAAATPSLAQTFTTLTSFNGENGFAPWAPVIQGTDGNFYGVTQYGGAYSGGTVFRITAAGGLTNLYNFSYNTYPFGALIQASDGNFYGTTTQGNTWGTVFKITRTGKLTTLHTFDGNDGSSPYAGLIQAADGSLFGTTYNGGASDTCIYDYGCGTVFKITRKGQLTTLYSFGGADGERPFAGLIQATDGNFYGTTSEGGTNGYGTVFKITGKGTLTTLHSFDGSDGEFPSAGLIQAVDGDFYGTTATGGAGNGTVFKITAGGTLRTLHNFEGTNGIGPYGGLIQATDANFYLTTEFGGIAETYCSSDSCGMIFELTPEGKLTALHKFDGTDGGNPYAALLQSTNGSFYGTTIAGGSNGYGTIFSLSMGLGSFVTPEPSSGRVGAKVIILGTDLTGATSVSFNGIAATFKVVSSSEIKTVVPAGAITGTVEVTTPVGALKSNVAFRVTQ